MQQCMKKKKGERMIETNDFNQFRNEKHNAKETLIRMRNERCINPKNDDASNSHAILQ